jgi:hypothetical protein
MFDERLPVVEVRLPRLDGDFVVTYAERVNGHLWRVGRDDLGWSWIIGRIAASERETVIATLDTGIAAFRRTAQADAKMIATAVADGRLESDEDQRMLVDAARRVDLSLRAIWDLQRDRATVATNQEER